MLPRTRDGEGREKARLMTHETIEAILMIERQAALAYEQARREAEAVVAQAREQAAELRKKTIAEARAEADKIIVAAKSEVERERAKLLAEAQEQATQLEEQARSRFDVAVKLVVDRVLGRA